MAEVTISSKNQIVIPREARAALRLKAGDKILIVSREDRILILQKPKSHRAALRGLGRDVYPSRYIRKERQSWG
jgi:AbrB family looped-hinge helix DNA binding protein